MDEIDPKERRIVIRRPGDTFEPVRLRLEGGELIAKVQDISVLGIGILAHQRLEPGTWLVLEPGKPSQSLTSELKAEVRHTRKCDSQLYVVGCRFSRPLTQEDVMALG